MPEGLKIIVGADVKEAERAMKSLTATATSEGKKAGTALGSGLNKSIPAIQNIPKAAAPAIQAVSKLGDTIETLRAKLLAKQSFLVTEKDIGKIAVLNTEIRELTSEIERVKRAGTTGFDSLGNAVTKSATGFGAFTAGAQKSFSALRLVANILPGIGIAGLIGLLSEGVVSLFKFSSGLDQSAVAATKFAIEINSIKQGLKEFEESLDFGADIDKLKNKLKFGDSVKTDLLNFNIDKKKNDEIINLANSQIDQLNERIGQLRSNASNTLGKNARELLQTFNVDLDIPDNLIDDLKESDKKVLREIKESATKIEGLQNQRLKAFEENSKGEIEVQIKKNERIKKLNDKFIDDTITKAKQLAAFLDKNTQFAVHFEVDPLDSTQVTFKKAKEFISDAKKFVEEGFAAFHFKPILIRPEFKFLDEKKFVAGFKKLTEEQATKTYDQLKSDFEKNIETLTKNSPLAFRIQAKILTDIRKEDVQRASLASGVGLKIEGVNAAKSELTDLQKRTIASANAITGVLTPAFQSLFSAIQAGENPLKAFFESIGNSVAQLIQKLIAAAIQAAVLNALFPGGIGGVKGFGGFFKNFLGFAKGGLVSGPTLSLIGEGRGTSRSNPEVVAPLDKLKGMLAGIAGNANFQPLVVTGRVRGRDISLSNSRDSRQRRRLGG
jgi:hypothetical protein